MSTRPSFERAVAFVGFACDAEYNSFADLSAHRDWRVPIIATGVRTSWQKFTPNKNLQKAFDKLKICFKAWKDFKSLTT